VLITVGFMTSYVTGGL